MKQLLTIVLTLLCFVSKAQTSLDSNSATGKFIIDFENARVTFVRTVCLSNQRSTQEMTLQLKKADKEFSVAQIDLQAVKSTLKKEDAEFIAKTIDGLRSKYCKDIAWLRLPHEHTIPTLLVVDQIISNRIQDIFMVDTNIFLNTNTITHNLRAEVEATENNKKDSVRNYYETSGNASGRGSGTFSIDTKTLQTYFTTKRTIKQFEQSLAKWSREPYEYLEGGASPEYAYIIDGRPTGTDIVRAVYTSTLMGQEVQIIVEFELNQIIRTISFHVDDGGTYTERLKKAGFQYDAASTRHGQFYASQQDVVYVMNPKTKVHIKLQPSEAGTFVVIMKGI